MTFTLFSAIVSTRLIGAADETNRSNFDLKINKSMHIRNFISDDYAAIVDIHNSQNIAWPGRPHTPEAWERADRSRSSQHPFQRWVAVEDGQVVGFGSYSSGPGAYPPGSFYINVEVLPAYQRRGIGSGLYDTVTEGVRAFDPPTLRADAFTNLPQGFAFMQKRGFREVFRETPVYLDVAAMDLQPYAGLEAKLKAEGVVIKTLSELKPDPGRDRKVYDLYWTVWADVPQEGDSFTPPYFDEWVGWGLNNPMLLQDAFFVAMCGEDYIGLRELASYGDGESLLGGLLGVRPEHRNRRIGLAMQLRGIAYAKEHGYRLLKSCTAVQNTPMQALFDKLGYERDPEWQQCQKDLKT
jgi:GNAT superfamily N-acetyltransferase